MEMDAIFFGLEAIEKGNDTHNYWTFKPTSERNNHFQSAALQKTLLSDYKEQQKIWVLQLKKTGISTVIRDWGKNVGVLQAGGAMMYSS